MLDFVGDLLGFASDQKTAKKNIKYQREFAQKGIGWRVQDAKESGIHPLYAIGANTASFQPVSGSGHHLSNAGESAQNALNDRRAKEYNNLLQEKNLQKMDADIEATKANTNNANAQAMSFIEETKRASDLARLNHMLRLGERKADQTVWKKYYNERTGEWERWVNPKLNLDYPETLGLTYYGRGQMDRADPNYDYNDRWRKPKQEVKKWQRPEYWNYK